MIPGENFQLNVEDPALPGTYLPVNDMNSFSKASDRDSNTYPVFQRAPYALAGARNQTYDVGGYLFPGDPGQQALLDAELSQLPINIEVLWDGVDGFRQDVKVASYSVDVDPESPQEIGFEFTADDAAVVVGAGPLL